MPNSNKGKVLDTFEIRKKWKTKKHSIILISFTILLALQTFNIKSINGQNKDDDEGEISSQREDELKPKIYLSIEGTDGDDKILDGTGANKIDGGEGNDYLHGKGGDIINWEFGNDKLKGGEGNDRIDGEWDNDKIDGGKGDDAIDGGEGKDTLDGGEGVDKLTGGSGADTFICDQFDTIIDFNTDEGDKIIGECTAEDQAKPTTVENITSANK